MARKLFHPADQLISKILFLLLALVWFVNLISPSITVQAIPVGGHLNKESNSHVEVLIPVTMRSGDTKEIVLTVSLDENFLNEEIDWGQFVPDENHSAFLSFETRLDLPSSGITLKPPGMINANMSPGHQQTFSFNVSAKEAGFFTGTLWVKMLFIPANETGKVYEKTIFAIPIEIKVNSILGMSQKQANLLSICGMLFSLIIIFFIKKKLPCNNVDHDHPPN